MHFFFSYHAQYKGYKCLDPVTSWIFITRHARFDEDTFPFGTHNAPTPLTQLSIHSFFDDYPIKTPHPITPPSMVSPSQPPPTVPCTLCVPLAPTPPSNPQPPPPISTPLTQPDDTNFISSPQSTSSEDSLPDDPHPSSSSSPTSPHIPPSPPTHGHPMITRAKARIFKPKHRVDISYVQINRFPRLSLPLGIPHTIPKLWAPPSGYEPSNLKCKLFI